MALSTAADIAIYGGAAGGGKTWTLLLEPVRHLKVPGFGAVTFRRTFPQIRNQGGLWQESYRIYPLLKGSPLQSTLEWVFPPHDTRVRFAHMEYEDTKLEWQGAQVPLINFDELTHFSATQFFYLLSRNRSTCGVPPYMRGACNPDPDSWLVCDETTGEWGKGFISYWIDPISGYPIPERAGVIRWFVRAGAELQWADTPAGLSEWRDDVTGTAIPPKSVTFIPANVYDNKILLARDPGYLANLHALHPVEREQLLRGNWKIRAEAGLFLNRAWFEILDAMPTDIIARIRYWDKAGTAKKVATSGTAYTAGAKLALSARGFIVIEDIVRGQWASEERERVIKQTARVDGPTVGIWVEQEPGSGGKESAENTIRNLMGYQVWAERVMGDKTTRATPLAAQAAAGNVKLLHAPWNGGFLNEAHAFPDGKQKDQVDATSGAFNKLAALILDQGDPDSEMYGDGGTVDDLINQEMGGGNFLR